MTPSPIFEGKTLRFDDRGDRAARHHLHLRGLDHPSRHRSSATDQVHYALATNKSFSQAHAPHPQ